jgi:hypothetical protein
MKKAGKRGLKKAFVDRIDEGIAAVIPVGGDGKEVRVPLSELPAGAKEGDTVDFETGEVTREKDPAQAAIPWRKD